MLSMNEAKALLNGAESYRGDCPDCGGSNSLSVNSVAGDIAWICFKASCRSRGRGSLRRTLDQIVAVFDRQTEFKKEFIVPPYFTSPRNSIDAMQYFSFLSNLGVDGKVEIRYDPKRDRAVYLIARDGEVVDAVGRVLRGGSPKWWRYGGSSFPFMLGSHKTHDTCVIVEDVASACVVGSLHASMALLGTSLSDIALLDLIHFKKVIVALDPDAYSKGVEMSHRISAYTHSKAVLIPDDLKYFNPHEVKEILNERPTHVIAG